MPLARTPLLLDTVEDRVARMNAGPDRARLPARPAVQRLYRAADRAIAAGTRRLNRGRGRGVDRLSAARRQRVVVQVHYVNHPRLEARCGALSAHVRYLGRDGAGQAGGRGAFFTADQDTVGAAAAVRDWHADPRHFRIMISPEAGDRIDDLPGYVRDVMGRMEADLGTRLEWVATCHHNTDQPHAHVVLRGVADDGTALIVSRSYISHGMRRRAEEAATERLGERTLDDLKRSLQRQAGASRHTELDRTIARHVQADGTIDVHPLGAAEAGQPVHGMLRARLQHLETLGLAEPAGSNTWRVRAGFEAKLKALGERADIVKSLHKDLGPQAGRAVPYRAERGAAPVAGRVVALGPADEVSTRVVLAVESGGASGAPGGASVHAVVLPDGRAADGVQAGSLVRVGPRDDRARREMDATMAKQAALHPIGLYEAQQHRERLARTQPEVPAAEHARVVAMHVNRLERHARAGLVEQTGPERFRVPSDLPQRAQAHEAARPARPWPRLTRLSALPTAAQVAARAETWLDRELARTGAGQAPAFAYDAATARDLAARRAWLLAHGHAQAAGPGVRFKPGARQALREGELRAEAARHGQRHVPLRSGVEYEGRYAGTVELHAGRCAVIARGDGVAVVPVARAPAVAVGQEVSVTLDGRGMATLGRSRGLGLG